MLSNNIKKNCMILYVFQEWARKVGFAIAKSMEDTKRDEYTYRFVIADFNDYKKTQNISLPLMKRKIIFLFI